MFAKDRNGFMPGLYVAFLDQLSSGEKQDFEKLNGHVERAKFILHHPFIAGKFDNIQMFDRKDNGKSLKAREEGNVLFQSGNVPASLGKYSSAVALAGQDSQELSLALANRSAALQRLRYHAKGVQDIDAALQAGYPADKQFKLLERRGQLLQELKQFDRARCCFSKARKLVNQSTLIKAKREKFEKEMDLQVRKLEGKVDCPEAEGVVRPQRFEVTELERHPQFKSLHRSVEVKETREQGRFTVAREEIRAGTTLLTEDPLGWALEVEKFPSHCQHCLTPVPVPVPCAGCVSAMFCSGQCREEGMDLYHRRECGLLGILAASALNNFCLLTVRAITRYSVRQILDLSKHMETSSEAGELYDGAELRTGLNLVSHPESGEELLMRTLVSVFLMKCLKQTEFYGQTETSPEEDLEVSHVIYRLLSSCPANTHEIHSLTTPSLDRWSPMATLQDLGAGLYPTAALFNHSCEPNIVRCSVGRRMVSVASRDIQRGEEISDCYGLPWYSKSRKTRQEITRKFYKFECGCRACQEKWPTSDLLGLTQKASPGLDLAELQCKVGTAGELLCSVLDWEGGIEELREAHSHLARLRPPTLEHFNIHIAIWRSIWMLAGNKKLSKLF